MVTAKKPRPRKMFLRFLKLELQAEEFDSKPVDGGVKEDSNCELGFFFAYKSLMQEKFFDSKPFRGEENGRPAGRTAIASAA